MVEQSGHNTTADIWCLGVLLYEMLIGSSPFIASEQNAIMGNITKNKPKFPKSLNQSVRDLLIRMLDKNPETRYDIM